MKFYSTKSHKKNFMKNSRNEIFIFLATSTFSFEFSTGLFEFLAGSLESLPTQD